MLRGGNLTCMKSSSLLNSSSGLGGCVGALSITRMVLSGRFLYLKKAFTGAKTLETTW